MTRIAKIAFGALALLALSTAPAFAQTAEPTKAPAAPAKTPTPARTKEVAPVTIDGAETFVVRALEPDPLRIHVAKPKGWKAGDKRPAYIHFFGGGWSRGTPEKSFGWAKYAAREGMVGFAPDYRTNDRFGTSPLESVADGRLALKWVQDHAEEFGIDPTRVVVAGSSAGGHVALWTGITAAPPGSDPAESPTIKPAALILLSAVSDTTTEKGYTPRRFGKEAKALSPIDQLDAKMPPMLIFHGDADATVPQAQSIALAEKLKTTGNVAEFVNVEGGSHSFSTDKPEWREKSRKMIFDFLRGQKILEPPAAAAK